MKQHRKTIRSLQQELDVAAETSELVNRRHLDEIEQLKSLLRSRDEVGVFVCVMTMGGGGDVVCFVYMALQLLEVGFISIIRDLMLDGTLTETNQAKRKTNSVAFNF